MGKANTESEKAEGPGGMTKEVLEGKHGPQGLRTRSNTTENKEMYVYIGYGLGIATRPKAAVSLQDLCVMRVGLAMSPVLFHLLLDCKIAAFLWHM